MSLSTIIEKAYWDELAKEGITKEDLEMVMLEIEFSPVTPYKGHSPCEVTETKGDKYIVHIGDGHKTVTTDELKVMRFRYLQFDPERVAMREQMNSMFGGK